MQSIKFLGTSPLVTSFVHPCGFINTVFTESLRCYRRKPLWLGTAKTKIFRVHPRPKLPEDEFLEIKRLYNNYRTYLKTTYAYFKEVAKQNDIQLDPAVIGKAEEEDFQKCSKINAEWNKAIAARREVELAEAMEKKKLKVLASIEKKQKLKEQKLTKLEKEVQTMKSIVPTLITRANVDQAIEQALANPVNYNKAITLDGEWYTEPTGIPPPKELKVAEAQQ